MTAREIAEIQSEHKRTALFTKIFLTIIGVIVVIVFVVYELMVSCVIPVDDTTDYLIHNDWFANGLRSDGSGNVTSTGLTVRLDTPYCNQSNKDKYPGHTKW